jgi:DNA invertase Pin-like site-specific DNA recombinase
MLVGYARVSTTEQTLDLQKDALHAAGCGEIFEDTVSGATAERPGLRRALDYLRPGDILVFWKLDRVTRSLRHLLELAEEFKVRGIGLKSLQDEIDTSTSMGKFFFHLMGAVAELERDILRERTVAGLAAARTRGRLGGRPPKLTAKQIAIGRALYDRRQHTVGEICEQLGCSPATFYRRVLPTTAAPDSHVPKENA